jgi:hypothetical protein
VPPGPGRDVEDVGPGRLTDRDVEHPASSKAARDATTAPALCMNRLRLHPSLRAASSAVSRTSRSTAESTAVVGAGTNSPLDTGPGCSGSGSGRLSESRRVRAKLPIGSHSTPGGSEGPYDRFCRNIAIAVRCSGQTGEVLLIDAANAVGSRSTGWWRDRAGAARAFVEQLRSAAGTGRLPTPVVVVLEGRARDGIQAGVADGVTVLLAVGSGDDTLIEVASDTSDHVTLITSDRGLRHRAELLGANVLGPRWLFDLLER